MADDGASCREPNDRAGALGRGAAVRSTQSHGQETAQREIATAIDNALDARRLRIIVSLAQINWVKWSCLLLEAVGLLVAIAMIHSDNPRTSAIAMGLFATGVAVSILLIASHNRPFTGEISVGPEPLLQVRPAG